MINKISKVLILFIIITLPFSIMPTIAQAKDKSIVNVSDENIKLTIGESIIINVTAAKNIKVVHAEEKSNSFFQIISFSWKTKTKLKITGVSKGKTKIVLTNSYNNEKVKIKVSVKKSENEKEIQKIIDSIGDLSPTPLSNLQNTTIINNASTIEENYEVLAEYLKTYGITNDLGESYIVKTSKDNSYTYKILYNSIEDEFTFSLKFEGEGTMPKSGRKTKANSVIFVYITPSDYEYAFIKLANLFNETGVGYWGTGYFDPTTYTLDSESDFDIEYDSTTASKHYNITELVDTLLKLLLIEIQSFFLFDINDSLDLDLKDLGFEEFVKDLPS